MSTMGGGGEETTRGNEEVHGKEWRRWSWKEGRRESKENKHQ